jgi:hypothetical protein
MPPSLASWAAGVYGRVSQLCKVLDSRNNLALIVAMGKHFDSVVVDTGGWAWGPASSAAYVAPGQVPMLPRRWLSTMCCLREHIIRSCALSSPLWQASAMAQGCLRAGPAGSGAGEAEGAGMRNAQARQKLTPR